MMTTLTILTTVYLAIAVLAMIRTLSEASRSSDATLLGTVLGCLVCLAWLPILLVVAITRSVQPKVRDLSSGL